MRLKPAEVELVSEFARMKARSSYLTSHLFSETVSSEEAATVMKVVDDLKAAVMSDPSLASVPQVVAHREASNDRGCQLCWLSSAGILDHPECQEKIDRWFRTETDLVNWAHQIRSCNLELNSPSSL